VLHKDNSIIEKVNFVNEENVPIHLEEFYGKLFTDV